MNIYQTPELERISGEEFVESFLELCHAARLLSDEQFANSKYFAQDVRAYTAATWRLSDRSERSY